MGMGMRRWKEGGKSIFFLIWWMESGIEMGRLVVFGECVESMESV